VIERATTAALRVGHTSGGAGVFGLLLGLNAWVPKAALRVGHIPGVRASQAWALSLAAWSTKAAWLEPTGPDSFVPGRPSPAKRRAGPHLTCQPQLIAQCYRQGYPNPPFAEC
jgi:hypothetical protein